MQVGIIFAIAPLTRFLVPFLFRKYFKLTISVFYFALFLTLLSSSLFFITIFNFKWFILPNLLLGASLGLILPFIEIYALEYLEKGNYGKSRLFGSLGFMIVAIGLSRILDNPNTILCFFLFYVLSMIGFSIIITFKNSYFKENRHKNGDIIFLTHWGFWLNIFFIQMSFGSFYNFFTIYQTDYGISIETTGWMWAFGVICEIILFYFQGPILKKFGLLNLIQFSSFITATRWFLLFMFPGYIFIAFFSQAFHAFSFALHHSAAFSYLQAIYENRSLAAQFYYGISFGLGAFLGALFAGWIYGPYLYLGACIIALIGAFVVKGSFSKDKIAKMNRADI